MAKQRCCSVCKQPGHNKRTCPQGVSRPPAKVKRSKVVRRPPVVEEPWVPEFVLEAKAPEPWGKVESVVDLDAASAEYVEQRDLFLRSFNGRKVEIYSIKRLQHPIKQMQYQLERQSMAMRDRCPVESIVEKTLFHGTSMEAVESINKYGFNRSYGAVQAYGNGVYFARDSTLSADTMYAKPGRNGHQMVYIAKVLTGHSTEGRAGMKYPPQRKAGVLFDSMVNSMVNPTIYVSGHNDNQIYAEYLVEFKQRVQVAVAVAVAKPPPLGYVRFQNGGAVAVSIWYMGPTPSLRHTPRKLQTLLAGGNTTITCYGQYGQVFAVCPGTRVPQSSAAQFIYQAKHGKFLDIAFVGNKCVEL